MALPRAVRWPRARARGRRTWRGRIQRTREAGDSNSVWEQACPEQQGVPLPPVWLLLVLTQAWATGSALPELLLAPEVSPRPQPVAALEQLSLLEQEQVLQRRTLGKVQKQLHEPVQGKIQKQLQEQVERE